MKLSDLRAGIKYRTAQGDFIAEAPYDKFRKLENGGYIAELDLKTEAGTFLFRDRVAEGEEGLFVQVNCTAVKLGAGTVGIGLHCGAAVGAPYEELSFFAPSAWYGKNELFEGKSNKYPLVGECAGGGVDGLGAPVCAAFNEGAKTAWEIEAVDPEYGAALPSSEDLSVDECNTLPGIGVRKKEEIGLFYELPATSYTIAGSERTVRWYRPAREGAKLCGTYRVRSFPCTAYRSFMRSVWRRAYDKYAAVNENIDTSVARKVLLRFTADSFGVVGGVPQYMTNADHFVNESGFLYRNADMALSMLAYGEEIGDAQIVQNAKDVLDCQVERGFAGQNQVFAFERSRAEGVYAVWQAYAYLKARGQENPSWYEFVQREADRFEKTDEYYSVPLLCETGRIEAARGKAERIWEKFSRMRFYGGIVDFLADPVLDRESGYIGMLDFLSMYDATGEEKWIDRAAFCGDYLETYQNLRQGGYFAYGTCGNEHYNMASVGNEDLKLNGLSFISANCNGTDVFNVYAAPLYYRLSLLCGDGHYYRYAQLLERNALEYIDLANKAGALCDVRLGAGIGFMNEYYQLAVSTDPVGPLTGTAHDAGIAWVQYGLLSSQDGILKMTGRPFLSPHRCETMMQNIAADCLFSCGGGDMSGLYGGDFYARTEFTAGDVLAVKLPSAAEKLVLAHAAPYAHYAYEVSFENADGKEISVSRFAGAARFACMRIPGGCVRFNIRFERGAALRQAQIFGFAPAERVLNLYAQDRRLPEGEYRNGSQYSAQEGKTGPWSYLGKKDGVYTPLYYDNKINAYRCADEEYLCVKTGALMHPGKRTAAVCAFTAPENGVYSVQSSLSPAPYLERFGAEIRAAVFAGEELAAEQLFRLERENCALLSFERRMHKGEVLYFEIHSVREDDRNCFVSDEIIIKKERRK